MNLGSPIPQEWESYITQVNLGLEVIPAFLYSTANYVTGTTILPLFTTVSGANAALTNMQQPNMLPNPESFLIQAIRVLYHFPVQEDLGAAVATGLAFPSQFNNVVQLAQRGIMELKIGNKQYGPYPLWALAAGNYVQGMIAATGTSAAPTVQNYGQVGGPMYSLFPNLMIAPLQQFNVTLSWPGGTVVLSPAQTLPIEVVFDGQLARSIQ